MGKAIQVQSRKGVLELCALLMVAPTAAFAQSSAAQSPAAQPSAPQDGATPAASSTNGSGGAKPAPVASVEGFTVTAAPSNKTTIDRKIYTVTSDVRAATGSLSDVLQNLPAVDVNPQSGISLRGDPNVTVLIDGKPAPQFQGANQAQALQSLSASQIDHIEVMTTPSAEFTASGSGGVINIVTKKNVKLGPTMTVGASYGPEGRTRANVSASYSGGKLSVAADANYRQEPYPINTQINSVTTSASGTSSASRFSNPMTGEYQSAGGGIKLTYQIDPKTQVYAGYRINYQALIDGAGPETLSTGTSLSSLTPDYTLGLDHLIRWQLNTTTAGFSHDFGGDQHQFTLDFQHELWPRKDVSLTGLVSGSAAATPDFQNITISFPFEQNLIKAVYRRPMPYDGRLLLGTDWLQNTLQANTIGLEGDNAQAATPSPLLGDRFHELETQQSFYGTYQQPIGKDLIVLAGVRVETEALRPQSMGVAEGAQNYTRVNPSLSGIYNLDKDTKLTFAYSRRMDRPVVRQYNPVLVYVNQTTYIQGNPNLQPSTTDSFEATVEHRHAGATYTATAYYRQDTDVISSLNEPLGNGVFVTQYANLAARRDAGVELLADGTLLKNLKYNFSTDIFHTQTTNAAGVGINEAGWVESGKANLNWSPTADDLFQVNGEVQGRAYLPQGYWEPQKNLNLGYRRNLRNGLFLTVTADDVLGTGGIYTQVLNSPGLNQRTKYKFNNRAVLFGLSYAFGGAPGRDKAAPKLDYGGGAGIGQ